MSQPASENKMGVMPENKLLLNMALPMIISMLIQACYNIVDSYFVSKLSEDALNAVSLAFPVQNLMIAVAVGTGVGINALLSKSLGEKKQDMVNKTAMNGLFLTLLSYLLFAVIGLTCSGLFFRAQTDIPEILDYGRDYMFLCCTLSFGLFFSITFERTLQSTGRTVYSMITQLIGAVINIILDPIFIYAFDMGVQGAALAGGDASGGLGRVRGELQAGGEVVGAAAGDVPQGRGIGEAHEAADRLVEGAVPAAADNAVKLGPLRLRQLRGVARVGGLAHGDQIALLAEVGHRLEQGAHGPGAAGPGGDNEQERLCHSETAFPNQNMKFLLNLSTLQYNILKRVLQSRKKLSMMG